MKKLNIKSYILLGDVMLKKYLSYLGIMVLASFSFYYTDKAADIVKRNDPIMKSIISNKNDYTIKSVSAFIEDDEVIPGINGLEVDVNKSYQNMKKINNYNTDMLVFDEVIPDISFIKEYDKYIVSGNNLKNQVALVFKINNLEYIDKLDEILIDKNVIATFFIDGSIISDNTDLITTLSNNGYEIENLGYDNTYSMDKFSWTNNLISSITKSDPKFCYTDYKSSEVIDLCSKYEMYTIKPTISISNYPFLTVKQNLSSGNIISFNTNLETIKELPSIITYIKQKGYDLVSLNDLINEKYYDEK